MRNLFIVVFVVFFLLSSGCVAYLKEHRYDQYYGDDYHSAEAKKHLPGPAVVLTPRHCLDQERKVEHNEGARHNVELALMPLLWDALHLPGEHRFETEDDSSTICGLAMRHGGGYRAWSPSDRETVQKILAKHPEAKSVVLSFAAVTVSDSVKSDVVRDQNGAVVGSYDSATGKQYETNSAIIAVLVLSEKGIVYKLASGAMNTEKEIKPFELPGFPWTMVGLEPDPTDKAGDLKPEQKIDAHFIAAVDVPVAPVVATTTPAAAVKTKKSKRVHNERAVQ